MKPLFLFTIIMMLFSATLYGLISAMEDQYEEHKSRMVQIETR